MPMGIGEPHNAQIIKADKLEPWIAYPEVGWNPLAQAPSEFATLAGEERIERDGNNVEVFMTSVRSHLKPEHVEIKKGDHVTWHITNIETAHDSTHGFQLGGYNISLSIEPGETVIVRVRRRERRRVRLLLHRVLLGAAPGDDGLYARGAVAATMRCRGHGA